jgi:hypothetical protein
MNIKKAKERQKKITQLTMNKLVKIENKILRLRRKAAVSTNKAGYFWAGIKKDIKKQYEEANAVWSVYASVIMPLVYKTQIHDEVDRIKKIKTIMKTRKIKIQATETKEINLNSNWHKNTIAALVNDMAIVMESSLEEGYKMTEGLLSKTQQQVLTEAEINQAIAEGLAEKGTVQQAKNRILEALRAELGEEFIIKAGSKRYTLEYYAELLARTKIREAQSQAVINTAVSVGSDLVQVSSHNTTTPICIPFEGRVFSISGTDKDFPPLTDSPPFHPNCLHSISVIFKEIIEQRGMLKEYSDFAHGKTEIHPTRTAHIPISKRGIA